MREVMDAELVRQRHEELLREAQTHRRAKALRAARRRRAGERPALAWEIKRHVGSLLKPFRVSRRVD
jgi:hypothetical protein